MKEKFDIDQFNIEEEDLLVYLIAVVDRFSPDFALGAEGEAQEVDSQAPYIFKRRYNNQQLKIYFKYSDYEVVCNTWVSLLL